MSKLGGLGIEVEEMGMVALMGALLVPGLIWISRAKGTQAILVRSVVVGVLATAAAVLEGTMDKATNEVTGQE